MYVLLIWFESGGKIIPSSIDVVREPDNANGRPPFLKTKFFEKEEDAIEHGERLYQCKYRPVPVTAQEYKPELYR